jgi:hypothetical protein
MIRPPLEDLVKSLARASETLAEATIAKKRANEAFNAVAHEIVTHYGSVEQLRMEFAAAQQQPVIARAADVEEPDEDDAEENDEETETVGAAAGRRHDGGEEGRVRSYAGAEGPE